MKRLCLVAVLCLLAVSPIFADTEDTAVFRTRMLPDNEVPPVSGSGNSAAAAITVNATRDIRGNISAATVTFDIDYTVTANTTFTGLHIHNAATGQNGPVVIDSGISGSSPVSVGSGSGRISRVVNYTSSDTNGLRFVTGLLATPENYYVNIHTTPNPAGFMRGQLLRNRLMLRPIMSPVFEVPAINIDAEGAALVDIHVNRDAQTGAITSGTVVFDVNYRFPSGVTITGLHLHNAAAGANGPVVIDSGLNGTSRSIASTTGRGNIFRIAEIDSANTAGIAALNGLMNDPTQFYINLHTSVNPGGVIRGQLSRELLVFFNQMTGTEEVPATTTGASSTSMTYVRVDRDSTGNVTGGAVSFNLNYNMNGGPVTFTGLHIHNAKFGVNGGVVINTGIAGGAASVVDDDGVGSISREVSIDPSNATAFDSLRGLVANPETLLREHPHHGVPRWNYSRTACSGDLPLQNEHDDRERSSAGHGEHFGYRLDYGESKPRRKWRDQRWNCHFRRQLCQRRADYLYGTAHSLPRSRRRQRSRGHQYGNCRRCERS
jgi:hypothetical protein